MAELKQNHKDEIEQFRDKFARLVQNKNEIVQALMLRDHEIKELTDPKGIKGKK